MIKKLLLITMCIYASLCVNAQTLHAIIFADTNDPTIGVYDKQDYINMTLEVNTIASATGMRLKKYFFEGNICSPTNLSKTLDNLRTSKDDVIIFYYSGHGVRSINDRSPYPQMCLGSHYEEHFFPLEKVLTAVKSQPARLKIVLGDCCNSVGTGVAAKEYASKGATVLTHNPINTYTNLFMNYRGTVIASGSQMGENSTTVSWEDGRPAGGAFTVCFLSILQNAVSNGLDANWNEIMEVPRQTTREIREHTPVFDINLSAIENPHESVSPENIATSPASENDEEIDRIELLTAIGNENNSIEERVKIKDDALAYVFASPNTKVEVVGRNGKTIVSTESAADFMVRLSTAHNLLNLVEVDSKTTETGQYSYLKIHEIYKQQ